LEKILLFERCGRTIGAKGPEALAFVALEFFERRDLFLVNCENGSVP
jgi:hypothetical protein